MTTADADTGIGCAGRLEQLISFLSDSLVGQGLSPVTAGRTLNRLRPELGEALADDQDLFVVIVPAPGGTLLKASSEIERIAAYVASLPDDLAIIGFNVRLVAEHLRQSGKEPVNDQKSLH